MKKIALIVVIGFIAGGLISCASSPPVNSLGEVEARFESTDVLIGANPQQGQVAYQAGQAMLSSNRQTRRAGGLVAGIGLVHAAGQDIANAPIRIRLISAAREVLLAAAIEQYGEDITIERIRFTLISQDPQTGLYQYTATGIVVPANN